MGGEDEQCPKSARSVIGFFISEEQKTHITLLFFKAWARSDSLFLGKPRHGASEAWLR